MYHQWNEILTKIISKNQQHDQQLSDQQQKAQNDYEFYKKLSPIFLIDKAFYEKKI